MIYMKIWGPFIYLKILAKFKGNFWIHGRLPPYVVFIVIEAYILGLFKI